MCVYILYAICNAICIYDILYHIVRCWFLGSIAKNCNRKIRKQKNGKLEDEELGCREGTLDIQNPPNIMGNFNIVP